MNFDPHLQIGFLIMNTTVTLTKVDSSGTKASSHVYPLALNISAAGGVPESEVTTMGRDMSSINEHDYYHHLARLAPYFDIPSATEQGTINW